MRLGLIADIHEHVEHLRMALDRLRDAGADRVVMFGDGAGRSADSPGRSLGEAEAGAP